MEHPKAVGDRSTLAIMVALQAAEIPFFLPFGENTRCDLVIDYEGRLARVQCKTGGCRMVRFGFAPAVHMRITATRRSGGVTISPTSTTSACTAAKPAVFISFRSQ
jgi:PD-(D/E)XK endonuclease